VNIWRSEFQKKIAEFEQLELKSDELIIHLIEALAEYSKEIASSGNTTNAQQHYWFIMSGLKKLKQLHNVTRTVALGDSFKF
jgi:hypothetical protein